MSPLFHFLKVLMGIGEKQYKMFGKCLIEFTCKRSVKTHFEVSEVVNGVGAMLR